MISIVLYGRNDNYGYNLAKRGALGLNCMAEVLSAPDDEILFVDYNTPDDFPTFPEAIADTLTEKARQRLRILRVRPEHHAPYASRSHLPVLEPIARNVAIRRSNPANRWVLATNIDMIFVPRKQDSMSAFTQNLPRGSYSIPRFEVPESLWESWDRRDPQGVLGEVERWGWEAFLNDMSRAIVGDGTMPFTAPGDFQLVERMDLFAIDGFHEGMLLGWHLDTNLFRRLSLLYGGAATSDLADRLFGYHCTHTRQITAKHSGDAPQDSYAEAYWVTQADLPEQRQWWGLADVEIEEISVQRPQARTHIEPNMTAKRTSLDSQSDSPCKRGEDGPANLYEATNLGSTNSELDQMVFQSNWQGIGQFPVLPLARAAVAETGDLNPSSATSVAKIGEKNNEEAAPVLEGTKIGHDPLDPVCGFGSDVPASDSSGQIHGNGLVTAFSIDESPEAAPDSDGPPVAGTPGVTIHDARLFSVLSWGHAATHWAAKVLNAHPEILCLHHANFGFGDGRTKGFSDHTYLEGLLNISPGYQAVGEVHGLPLEYVPLGKERFGSQFVAVVLVREPIARLISQISHFGRIRKSGRNWQYDLEYIHAFAESRGIAPFRGDDEKTFFAHGVNMLNTILEEQDIGTIYRFEDLTANPEWLAHFFDEVTGGTVRPSLKWIEQIIQTPPVMAHRNGIEVPPFDAWQIDVLRKLVDPQAWSLYAKLGYAPPAFLDDRLDLALSPLPVPPRIPEVIRSGSPLRRIARSQPRLGSWLSRLVGRPVQRVSAPVTSRGRPSSTGDPATKNESALQ